jgi:hypothetical protein
MEPAMMCGIEPVNKIGCYFNNVKRVVFDHFQINNQNGDEMIVKNVEEIIKKD